MNLKINEYSIKTTINQAANYNFEFWTKEFEFACEKDFLLLGSAGQTVPDWRIEDKAEWRHH